MISHVGLASVARHREGIPRSLHGQESWKGMVCSVDPVPGWLQQPDPSAAGSCFSSRIMLQQQDHATAAGSCYSSRIMLQQHRYQDCSEAGFVTSNRYQDRFAQEL